MMSIDYSVLNQNDSDVFYLDVAENAIDSLETAASFLSCQNKVKWKWISIALHHSLYSFCISCLSNGNPDLVQCSDKKLIGFHTAFERVQDKNIINNPLILSVQEKQSIKWLTEILRNGFIHFIPRVSPFSVTDIKLVCNDVVRVIRFLALESHAVIYVNDDKSKTRIQKALNYFCGLTSGSS